MGQVAAGVELEDEDVVDSSLSPAIGVDTQEKEEFYQEKATSIDSHQWPHIWSIYESHTWQRQKKREDFGARAEVVSQSKALSWFSDVWLYPEKTGCTCTQLNIPASGGLLAQPSRGFRSILGKIPFPAAVIESLAASRPHTTGTRDSTSINLTGGT